MRDSVWTGACTLVASLATVLASSAASAQPAEPPPPPPAEPYSPPPAGYARVPTAEPPPPAPERSGFLIGGGLGAGSVEVADDFGNVEDYGSFFWEFHLGGMLSPRAALVLEAWGSSHQLEEQEGSGELYQANAGVAGQYWVSPRFWLKGGLGTARLGVHERDQTIFSRRGAGLLLSGGYELLHEPQYALDLQIRMTVAGYEQDEGLSSTSSSFQLAFTWF